MMLTTAVVAPLTLKGMFSYLKTVPPIKNRVPDYAPPK
jgi:hypothetical protein